MPTTPPPVFQASVDTSFTPVDSSAPTRRPSGAHAQAHAHSPAPLPAATPIDTSGTTWLGEAWALWQRRPQDSITMADNPGLNSH